MSRRLARWLPGRRPALLVLLVAAGILATAAGSYLWWQWQGEVSTDDAFVEARVAPISAKVAGTVVEVLVTDNQEVQAGDVLVRLDPRDFEVRLQQARAALLTAQGGRKAAAFTVPLVEESTESAVRQARAALEATRLGGDMTTSVLEERRGALRAKRAAVAAARAEIEASVATLERTHLDRDRTERLHRANLVAAQELDRAEEAFRTARARQEVTVGRLAEAEGELARAEAEVRSAVVAIDQARRRLEEAQAALAGATGRGREVQVRAADVETAEGRTAEAAANLRQAELNLDYTTIRAPLGGRVTRKGVEVGQIVQSGQPLLAVVSLDEMWVVANYKETQLTHVRPGQRARVTVDTYPGLILRARVDSIQSGTGGRFSLLPPENASGNFVKVVQRIPVKLLLEPGKDARRVLAPGMSVVPTIELR